MSGWEWVGVGLSRIIFRQTQQRLHPFAAGAALYSFAPPGLVGRLRLMTHGLRRGLHSFAPSGLVRDVCRPPTACAVGCVLALLRSCGLRFVSGLSA
jgi:hypothetical protein